MGEKRPCRGDGHETDPRDLAHLPRPARGRQRRPAPARLPPGESRASPRRRGRRRPMPAGRRRPGHRPEPVPQPGRSGGAGARSGAPGRRPGAPPRPGWCADPPGRHRRSRSSGAGTGCGGLQPPPRPRRVRPLTAPAGIRHAVPPRRRRSRPPPADGARTPARPSPRQQPRGPEPRKASLPGTLPPWPGTARGGGLSPALRPRSRRWCSSWRPRTTRQNGALPGATGWSPPPGGPIECGPLPPTAPPRPPAPAPSPPAPRSGSAAPNPQRRPAEPGPLDRSSRTYVRIVPEGCDIWVPS